VAKTRFVLRYRGKGATPDVDVAKVRELTGSVVVDSSSRMLLVESGNETHLRELVDALPDWFMDAERIYDVPDTRKKALRPPD